MKLFLSILILVTAASAADDYEPIQIYYHESVGIPEAARIKAAEEAAGLSETRIVGGSAARLGQFPYMGGLLITLRNGATSVCGSSLLTTTRLVTAAHCWYDGRYYATRLTAVLGSLRLYSGGTRVNTSSALVHANYNQTTLDNDIAIVIIPAVTLSSDINVIQLASGTDNYAGRMAQAIGFGRTGDNVGIRQNQTLSYVQVPVISNEECRRTYGSIITPSKLCARTVNGRATCNGDSGGPLVIGNNLVGLMSFVARDGCQSGLPLGFTRVTTFNSWILERL